MTTSIVIAHDAAHTNKLLLLLLLLLLLYLLSVHISVAAESERRNVPVTQKALPRWISTERRWRWNDVERGSWVTVISRRPISKTRWKACSPQVPDVSIAKGMMKSTPVVMSAYFYDFIASAVAAVEPARVLLVRTWDTANVSGQVTSHARQRPRDQETCVTPSGRLPLQCTVNVVHVSPVCLTWWMHDRAHHWFGCGASDDRIRSDKTGCDDRRRWLSCHRHTRQSGQLALRVADQRRCGQ